jgi:hypothetical protein
MGEKIFAGVVGETKGKRVEGEKRGGFSPLKSK